MIIQKKFLYIEDINSGRDSMKSPIGFSMTDEAVAREALLWKREPTKEELEFVKIARATERLRIVHEMKQIFTNTTEVMEMLGRPLRMFEHDKIRSLLRPVLSTSRWLLDKPDVRKLDWHVENNLNKEEKKE